MDDQEIFSLGLDFIIKKRTSHHIVARFKNGKDALDYLFKGHAVDLVILDLNMPVIDGWQLLSHLSRNFYGIKKLVVSMQKKNSTIRYCETLGADGFICKDAVLSELERALREVLKGNKYFCYSSKSPNGSQNDNLIDLLQKRIHLTPREVQVLQLILNQYLTNEIAQELNTSPFTIKTHRRNIFKKLGIRNLAGLISFLQEMKREVNHLG